MKKNIFLSISALLVLFTACEDYNDANFKGLDDQAAPKVVKTFAYTLTDADYATVGNNSTNKALAEAAGNASELANLKTTKAFTTTLPASTYLPAFIGAKWFTYDDGSAVKVTYNQNQGREEYMSSYESPVKVLSSADYKSIDSNVGIAQTFYPSKPASTLLPAFLKTAYPSAASGDICLAYYKTTDNEPVVGQAVVFEESFNSGITNFTAFSVSGDQVWVGGTTGSDVYAKMSGYASGNKENEDWLVSPQIDLTGQANVVLKVRQVARYINGLWDQITINVSSDYNGTNLSTATWTPLTINTMPTGADWNFVESEDVSLAAYEGKKIYVAFKYLSTTTNASTWEIDYVKVLAKGLSAEGVSEKGTYYKYSGSAWVAQTNAIAVGESDYTTMGVTNKYFSSSVLPANYLPLFLQQKYPFAQEGTKIIVGYKYSNATTYVADEYVISSGEWAKVAEVVSEVDQFVRANGVWVWDPSVVINLSPIRNDATIMAYYQAATDWVWENIDQAQLGISTKGQGYVTSYGNNEYYTGSSAYYNNVDMRPSAARAQYAAGYADMTDDQVKALMSERLAEVMGHVLEKLHPDAKAIDGVDVTYTVNVPIYTGTTVSAVTHSLVYRVVGDGQFEYVSGPTAL
ncbi:MAG: choice-of-anchor J domain-containing protein [Breznakibacter sp.]